MFDGMVVRGYRLLVPTAADLRLTYRQPSMPLPSQVGRAETT